MSSLVFAITGGILAGLTTALAILADYYCPSVRSLVIGIGCGTGMGVGYIFGAESVFSRIQKASDK